MLLLPCAPSLSKCASRSFSPHHVSIPTEARIKELRALLSHYWCFVPDRSTNRQTVRRLSHMGEDLTSATQNPHKKIGRVACTCNLVTVIWEVEIGRFLAAQRLTSLADVANLHTERSCQKCLSTNNEGCPLISTYASFTHTSTRTTMHAHTRTVFN